MRLSKSTILFLLLSARLPAQQTVTTTGGTANTLAKFSGAHAIVNSAVTESGGHVGIGTQPTAAALAVQGLVYTSGGVKFPDGTVQETAQSVGPQGPAGPQGPVGPAGLGLLEPGASSASNTGAGVLALASLTSGIHNTAIGGHTLEDATTSSDNTAVGVASLEQNTTGSSNTGVGSQTMVANTTGSGNAAFGVFALTANASGSNNTAFGLEALTASTGSNNIGIGFYAGSSLQSGDNNIYIGSSGTASESNVTRIGTPGQQKRAFLAGVAGVNLASGISVVVDSNGQLGVLSSSRRYKDNIQAIGDSSDSLMKLRPVSFQYKGSAGIEYGLVAEEVAQVLPETVVFKEGQPEAVQYHKINALLLNEVQKHHAEIELMKQELAELKSLLASVPR